jgi:hypothetical protein
MINDIMRGNVPVGKKPADFIFPQGVTREEFLNTLKTVASPILIPLELGCPRRITGV